VARLAAQGRTNRAIADALFISPKTVEANLARVYRKLRISSRAELGAAMGGPHQLRSTTALHTRLTCRDPAVAWHTGERNRTVAAWRRRGGRRSVGISESG
jgi:hypothetical protein